MKERPGYVEGLMNTCVSLSCPFIPYCRFYNFLVERGERCAIQQEIVFRAERLKEKEEKANGKK